MGNENVVTSSTAPVTISISANPAEGTLAGTLTAAAVNGIATFPDLSINNVGNGYVIKAVSGSLTAAVSSAFNITPYPITLTVQSKLIGMRIDPERNLYARTSGCGWRVDGHAGKFGDGKCDDCASDGVGCRGPDDGKLHVHRGCRGRFEPDGDCNKLPDRHNDRYRDGGTGKPRDDSSRRAGSDGEPGDEPSHARSSGRDDSQLYEQQHRDRHGHIKRLRPCRCPDGRDQSADRWCEDRHDDDRRFGSRVCAGFRAVNVTVVSSFRPTSIYINLATTTSTTLNISAPAQAGGLTFTLTSDDPTVATVPATISMVQGTTSVQIPITGVANGTTTIRANSPGVAETTMSVTVNSTIVVSPTFTAYHLQYYTDIYLPVTPQSPITVTVTLPDTSTALITSSPTAVGTKTVTFNNVTSYSVGRVYLQGVAPGATTLTVSAPGFTTGSGAITVYKSGFSFYGYSNSFPTTTFAATTSVRGSARWPSIQT